MQYNFPEKKELNGFMFSEQLEKIEEELQEVKKEYYNEETKIDSIKIAEKVLDLLHAVETLVRICEKRLPDGITYNGITIDEIKSYVVVKNAMRGYYE